MEKDCVSDNGCETALPETTTSSRSRPRARGALAAVDAVKVPVTEAHALVDRQRNTLRAADRDQILREKVGVLRREFDWCGLTVQSPQPFLKIAAQKLAGA
jgi:hypothetical protein